MAHEHEEFLETYQKLCKRVLHLASLHTDWDSVDEDSIRFDDCGAQITRNEHLWGGDTECHQEWFTWDKINGADDEIIAEIERKRVEKLELERIEQEKEAEHRRKRLEAQERKQLAELKARYEG